MPKDARGDALKDMGRDRFADAKFANAFGGVEEDILRALGGKAPPPVEEPKEEKKEDKPLG